MKKPLQSYAEKDPITASLPDDWNSEQKTIAQDTMALLLKHYPGWVWQLEWTPIVGAEKSSALLIRIGDVLTNIRYIVQLKDLKSDLAKSVIEAGGLLLESLGLSRSKNRHDEIHDLKRTAAGLIIPEHAAMSETQLGYSEVKKQNEKMQMRSEYENFLTKNGL